MKIELKRITTNARLSQETNAFAADIWIDGKRVGDARNEGTGGQTFYHIMPRELADQARAFAKTLPPCPIDGDRSDTVPLPMDLPFMFDLLVGQHLQEKADKRMCRTHLVFRLKGDEPEMLRKCAGSYAPDLAAAIRKKHGDALEEILNERFLPGAPPRPLYLGDDPAAR